MALHGLLARGIRSTLAEHRAELELIAMSAGHPEGSGEHLAQALEAMPGLLVALDRAVSKSDQATQRLWLRVVSYLLLDDDIIPSRDGAPLAGLLDDAYLVHAVVERLMERVSFHTPIETHSVSGGARLLRSVLTPAVVRQLDDQIRHALGEQ